jgi:hypothetical protein
MRMSILNALASVAVRDLSKAAGWYERLFERGPDSRPMAQLAEWRFERGGWLQVYELEERAGSCSVTLATDDLTREIAHLNELGIDAVHPSLTDKVKVVMIKDPDGNSIAFAQALDPSLAQ